MQRLYLQGLSPVSSALCLTPKALPANSPASALLVPHLIRQWRRKSAAVDRSQTHREEQRGSQSKPSRGFRVMAEKDFKDKECCTAGPPAREHASVGKEEKWSGLDVYVNWPTGATQAVVLATDVFGWDRPLLRKLADKIAEAGFVTATPDFFKGDPMNPDKMPSGEQAAQWFTKHPFESATADTLTTIKVLKEKGIKSVGVAGFCYGGKVGTLVSKDGVTDATVMLHPGRVTVDDIKAHKGPLAILAAELDKTTTVELVEEYKKVLESQNEVEYLVKVFPGVGHGWSVRYDENDEKSFSPAYESHADTIAWFKKYLK